MIDPLRENERLLMRDCKGGLDKKFNLIGNRPNSRAIETLRPLSHFGSKYKGRSSEARGRSRHRNNNKKVPSMKT